ncbi:PTS sugar transporter subunit IIC [Enterococcus sp.]|uniref:PTS sugar transporter subunit IIC n=1 Tax=Enterococcus sp. TaxID=35783 RepID=UPI00291159F4|nr:PTS transporter subunit EIIC [Enterococcus sp.]MDU5336549.1 PTS transporter subunit EIIC [Enterococcus sp.]
MSKDIESFSSKINVFASKIQTNRYMQSIMSGMLSSLPVLFIGSVASIIKNLPITPYQNFLTHSKMNVFFDKPITIANNVVALIVVFSISYTLAKSFKKKIPTISELLAGFISLVSFLILTPYNEVSGDFGTSYSLPMNWLGAQGMFTAIITAFISCRIFVLFYEKDFRIKMPDSVPEYVSNSFSALIPGLFILSLFSIIAGLFSLTSFESVHNLIYMLVQQPLSHFGSGIWSLMLISIISQLLWLFGIHGGMVVVSTISVALMPLDIAQLQAFSMGQALPNITGMQFFLIYTNSVALPITLLCLFFAKSKRYKTLGKTGIIPSLFGIDEPMIFGTPLVLNFKLAIPFVFQGAISLGLAYIVTNLNFIPRLTGVSVPTGTPFLINGILSGGWKIALFQFILLLLRTVIWYIPFRNLDKEELEVESLNDN